MTSAEGVWLRWPENDDKYYFFVGGISAVNARHAVVVYETAEGVKVEGMTVRKSYDLVPADDDAVARLMGVMAMDRYTLERFRAQVEWAKVQLGWTIGG